MAVVEGLEKLLGAFTARLKARDMGVSVSVGYTAAYAVYVHEDLEARHPVGQAKFLEEPARVHRNRIAATVLDGFRRGLAPAEALLRGGLLLQAESQRLVPVDTGALRASAFTALDGGTNGA